MATTTSNTIAVTPTEKCGDNVKFFYAHFKNWIQKHASETFAAFAWLKHLQPQIQVPQCPFSQEEIEQLNLDIVYASYHGHFALPNEAATLDDFVIYEMEENDATAQVQVTCQFQKNVPVSLYLERREHLSMLAIDKTFKVYNRDNSIITSMLNVYKQVFMLHYEESKWAKVQEPLLNLMQLISKYSTNMESQPFALVNGRTEYYKKKTPLVEFTFQLPGIMMHADKGQVIRNLYVAFIKGVDDDQLFVQMAGDCTVSGFTFHANIFTPEYVKTPLSSYMSPEPVPYNTKLADIEQLFKTLQLETAWNKASKLIANVFRNSSFLWQVNIDAFMHLEEDCSFYLKNPSFQLELERFENFVNPYYCQLPIATTVKSDKKQYFNVFVGGFSVNLRKGQYTSSGTSFCKGFAEFLKRFGLELQDKQFGTTVETVSMSKMIVNVDTCTCSVSGSLDHGATNVISLEPSDKEEPEVLSWQYQLNFEFKCGFFTNLSFVVDNKPVALIPILKCAEMFLMHKSRKYYDVKFE